MSYLPRGNGRRPRDNGDGTDSADRTGDGHAPTPDEPTPDDRSDDRGDDVGEQTDASDATAADQEHDPDATERVPVAARDSASPEQDPLTILRGRGTRDDASTASRGPVSRRHVRQQHRAGRRRPFVLTGLSTLVPGSGLTLARRKVIGIPLLVLFGIGVVLGIVYLIRRGLVASALDLAARPGLLRGAVIVLIVVAVVWIGQIVLTALVSRPRPTGRSLGWGLTAFTTVMCLVVAAPVVYAVTNINAHTEAADRIFEPRPTSAGGNSTLTRDPEAPDPWAGIPRVNVLLLGSDASDTREGTRTDSMIVASIDTETGETVLFSIPRNLEKVPIPDDNPLSEVWPNGYDCGAECLMNAVWTEAEAAATNDPEAWEGIDNPGLTTTQDVLSEVLGLPIDHTVIVNLDGFAGLVDAMGGVDINVQERVPIGGQLMEVSGGGTTLVPGSESGWIEVGEQRLNGRQALWYSRSRAVSTDFNRMRRQRCVVGALVNQVDPVRMLSNYSDIARVAGDNIRVDIAQDDLPAWVDLVLRVQDASIKSLPFTSENVQVWDPDYDGIRAEVQEAIAPEPEPTVEASPSGPSGDDASPDAADSPAEEESSETAETEDPTSEDTESATPTGVPTDDELSDLSAVC